MLLFPLALLEHPPSPSHHPPALRQSSSSPRCYWRCLLASHGAIGRRTIRIVYSIFQALCTMHHYVCKPLAMSFTLLDMALAVWRQSAGTHSWGHAAYLCKVAQVDVGSVNLAFDVLLGLDDPVALFRQSRNCRFSPEGLSNGFGDLGSLLNLLQLILQLGNDQGVLVRVRAGFSYCSVSGCSKLRPRTHVATRLAGHSPRPVQCPCTLV